MIPTPTAARFGLLQICLAGVLWGTGGLGMRVITDHSDLSFLTVSAYRMIIAALVLVAAAVVLGGLGDALALLRQRPGRAIAVGAGTGIYQALYFAAVVDVGVTVSTVVSLGLAPVLLTVGEAVHARRKPSARNLGVLALALAGLLLVSLFAGSAGGGQHPTRGLVEAIASGTTYAVTTALGRALAATTGPLALTTTTTTVGAITLIPLALIGGGPFVSGNAVTIGTLLYLGILTMALAYGLFYAGLRTTPGSAAVVATLLEPVTAAVAAAIFVGERLDPAGIVGTLMILAAVVGLAGVSQ